MQVMAATGTEHGVVSKGLGWFDAQIIALEPQSYGLKSPHMGYNGVVPTRSHPLFSGLSKEAEFYFVHSYHMSKLADEDVLATSEHGEQFTCAVARDNIMGVQFHPEKSHDNGIKMIENFIDFVGAHK